METFQVGEWRVRPQLNRIERGEEVRHIEPRAMDLLLHFALHAGEVLTKDHLISEVWQGSFVTDGALTYSITQLRQILGDDARQPRYLETISRRGYRLIAEVTFDGEPEPGHPLPLWEMAARKSQDSHALRERISGHRVSLRLLRPLEAEQPSPYPGLASFLEDDAPYFFGRETQVEELWGKILQQHLLAVIGPSGAGKTSFLRAGLIPARPAGWGTAYATPGASPGLGLARALMPALAGEPGSIDSLLAGVTEMERHGSDEQLIQAIKIWRFQYEHALLLFDQFEELFTLNPVETQARICALLAHLSTTADIHIVLSLRDDFLVRCCEHSALSSVIRNLTVLLPPDQEGLRRALTQPARQCGFDFEDEALVEEIVASVQGVRGALPLLAFAVSELWSKRDHAERLLTRSAYQEIKGVEGALAEYAERTLERVGVARQDLVREIFRNLMTSQGTRAVIDREELLSVFPERGPAEEVLNELVDSRLLTTYKVESKEQRNGHHRVEVIHESLLRAWPRLVRWKAQDEEGAVLREQLRQAAHLWEAKGRSVDLLWTETAYKEYKLWRERYRGSLSQLEEDFAQAMEDYAGRRRRHRRLALTALFAFLVIVIGIIWGLLRETDRALGQAIVEQSQARASKLVAIGRLELERYPTAALAYARRSLETADTIEGRLLAVEALWRGAPARILPVPEASAMRTAVSPDGTHLAVSGFGTSVYLVSEDGTQQKITGLPAVAYPRGVSFEPDGHLLTFVVRDPLVRRFSVEGRLIDSLHLELESVRAAPDGRMIGVGPGPAGPSQRLVIGFESGGMGPTENLGLWTPDWDIGPDQPGTRAPSVIDPDAKWLIYGRDRRIFFHPLKGSETQREFQLGGHDQDVRALVVDHSGTFLASADDGGGVRLWSIPERRLLNSIKGEIIDRFSALSFDRTGTRLSWSSSLGRVSCVWELEGIASAPVRCFQHDARQLGETTLLPSQDWLASSGYGLIMNLFASPQVRVLGRHQQGPILDLVFSPDSTALASCARDGLRLWPLTPGGPAASRVELPRDYFAYGADWLPSGEELVVSAPVIGAYLVSKSGAAPQLLLPYPSQTMALGRVAVDPQGRTAAITSWYSAESQHLQLYLIDLATRKVRTLPLRHGESNDPWKAGVRAIDFSHDGRLIYAGDGGIHRWDPESGKVELLAGGPGTFATMAMDETRTRVIASVGSSYEDLVQLRDAYVLVLDLETLKQRIIRTHGDRLTLAIAIDLKGEMIVTGDATGAVRVSSIEGEEPHLLLGHSGAVSAVAVSPDRKWIASASGAEIRIWPMPDISRPPLHTLPYEELIEKLKSLTNLEAVEDSVSVTGYRLEVGPFPGWKDVPTW